MNTLIYIALLIIAKENDINEDDTISVITNSIEKGLNPIDEFRKAFYLK